MLTGAVAIVVAIVVATSLATSLTPRDVASVSHVARSVTTTPRPKPTPRVVPSSLSIPPAFRCIEKWESTDQNAPEAYGQSGYWQIADVSLHSIAHLPGTASQYSKTVQLKAAELILQIQGWKRGWPLSSHLCGLS